MFKVWRGSDVFMVNSKQISYLCSSVPIITFEQVNADWVAS